MTPLATSADVIDRLGRGLSASEALRIDAILTDVSSAVRNYTGQTISEATTTDRVRSRRGVATLPQRPVTAVTSVVNATTSDPVLYLWDGFDKITTTGNVPDDWASVPFSNIATLYVDVANTHGYNPIPDDIIGIVCSIAIRALGRRPEDAGMTSESIAGYSYSIGAAGAAGAFGMLADERAVLDGYKRSGGVIYTGGF